MDRLKLALVFAANLVVYWSSRLIPRSGDVWVFGSWFGERYTDSPRYLFEYVACADPSVRPVWLTTSRSVLALVRARGLEAHLAYSPVGYWLSARARYGIVCASMKDINRFVPPRHIVNLWHGHPLKKIMLDDDITARSHVTSPILIAIFPFLKYRDLPVDVIASCDEEAAILRRSFGISAAQTHVTGLPRNDALAGGVERRPSHRMSLLYMPTHRGEGHGKMTQLFDLPLVEIDARLEELGAVLYFKPHYYHASESFGQYANILVVESASAADDVYDLVNRADILITDYSSVFFDYLLTGRPIIFSPFDLDVYRRNDRGFNYAYDEVTPGPHCSGWAEVLHWAGRLLADPSLYSAQRQAALARFHVHADARASERVHGLLTSGGTS